METYQQKRKERVTRVDSFRANLLNALDVDDEDLAIISKCHLHVLPPDSSFSTGVGISSSTLLKDFSSEHKNSDEMDGENDGEKHGENDGENNGKDDEDENEDDVSTSGSSTANNIDALPNSAKELEEKLRLAADGQLERYAFHIFATKILKYV